MNKSLIIYSIIIGFMSGTIGMATPQTIHADFDNLTVDLSSSALVYNSRLTFCKIDKSSYGVKKTVKMWVTGYESKPEQTDNSPRIASSGKEVFDGMVAVNGLPFGTKIRIREIFGDRELEVWDRMHSRKKGIVDIWMENGAKEFGARLTTIEILES